jgi:hypothetical protein
MRSADVPSAPKGIERDYLVGLTTFLRGAALGV